MSGGGLPGISRPVASSQQGIHPRLAATVRRHLDQPSRKPPAGHTRQAFAEMLAWLGGRAAPLVFDSCCGTGWSTRALALALPSSRVVGIDKSSVRLAAAPDLPANALLLRADYEDLWRLAADHGLRLAAHYLLYPNPWPKPGHLQRRVHGSAAFADLLRLGGDLEVRSNWRLYLDEFAAALAVASVAADIEVLNPAEPLTAFERKYAASGHELWRLAARLP